MDGFLLETLLDEDWNLLDLSGCGHLKPSTLLQTLKPLKNLRHLDLAGCRLTNQVVYGLPVQAQELRELRLEGRYPLVERAAWAALVPSVPSGETLDCWEDAPTAARDRCRHPLPLCVSHYPAPSVGVRTGGPCMQSGARGPLPPALARHARQCRSIVHGGVAKAHH